MRLCDELSASLTRQVQAVCRSGTYFSTIYNIWIVTVAFIFAVQICLSLPPPPPDKSRVRIVGVLGGVPFPNQASHSDLDLHVPLSTA